MPHVLLLKFGDQPLISSRDQSGVQPFILGRFLFRRGKVIERQLRAGRTTSPRRPVSMTLSD